MSSHVFEVETRHPGAAVLPPIFVGHDVDRERVVVSLDLDHARRLTSFLAQLDSSPDRQRAADAFTLHPSERAAWHRAVVDVLAEATLAKFGADAIGWVPVAEQQVTEFKCQHCGAQMGCAGPMLTEQDRDTQESFDDDVRWHQSGECVKVPVSW